MFFQDKTKWLSYLCVSTKWPSSVWCGTVCSAAGPSSDGLLARFIYLWTQISKLGIMTKYLYAWEPLPYQTGLTAWWRHTLRVLNALWWTLLKYLMIPPNQTTLFALVLNHEINCSAARKDKQKGPVIMFKIVSLFPANNEKVLKHLYESVWVETSWVVQSVVQKWISNQTALWETLTRAVSLIKWFKWSWLCCSCWLMKSDPLKSVPKC